VVEEIERIHKWDVVKLADGTELTGAIRAETTAAYEFQPQDGGKKRLIPLDDIAEEVRKGDDSEHDVLTLEDGTELVGTILREVEESCDFQPREGGVRQTLKDDDVVSIDRRGRPMLIGTTDVEKSEKLSAMLKRRGVKHELLNAKPEFAAREAEIVAQAGRIGAVTIATNMAGPGTHIILGGNPDTPPCA